MNSDNSENVKQHKQEEKISTQIDFSGLLPHYMDLQESFVATDLQKAKANSKKLVDYISSELISTNELKESKYEQRIESLLSLSKGIEGDSDIEKARKKFSNISVLLIDIMDATKSFDDELYVLKCPMATVGDSAVWLSKNKNVLNPYYGDKMLNCGFVKRELK